MISGKVEIVVRFFSRFCAAGLAKGLTLDWRKLTKLAVIFRKLQQKIFCQIIFCSIIR